MKKYFELYDGMAVTTEDFIHAMSVANNNFDFKQFEDYWYTQSGTPDVTVKSSYDAGTKALTLTIEQSCPPTPGQKQKRPFHFPFQIGLVGPEGEDIPVKNGGVLSIKKQKESFTFKDVAAMPVLSLNRSFSAPVNVHASLSNEDWCHLLAFDSDPVGRYEASQVLAQRSIDALLAKKKGPVLESHSEAFGKLLEDTSLEPGLKAQCLLLPDEKVLHLDYNPLDIEGIFNARQSLKKHLAGQFQSLWEDIYHTHTTPDSKGGENTQRGRRFLAGVALSYLGELEDKEVLKLVYGHFQKASNMTDYMAALTVLSRTTSDYREEALKHCYDQWKSHRPCDAKMVLCSGREPPSRYP